MGESVFCLLLPKEHKTAFLISVGAIRNTVNRGPINYYNLQQIPDYLNDLNAVAQARRQLTPEQKERFCSILNNLVRARPLEKAPYWWALIDAPADLQCEAIIRAIGKWEET
jgi:hypothetical protein